jgi:acyl-coenzyme A synthetase/AMP-(fatty) acid ligase
VNPTTTWASVSSRRVVRRPGKQVSGDELVSYVARMLDPHKRPRVVRFVDELPHDALGKVQKNRLPR